MTSGIKVLFHRLATLQRRMSYISLLRPTEAHQRIARREAIEEIVGDLRQLADELESYT